MDQRQTFATDNELLSFVSNLFNQKEKLSLLVDTEGLSRMEGLVTSIQTGDTISKSVITIDNSSTILLDQIIAVNGLFRSDYSEC